MTILATRSQRTAMHVGVAVGTGGRDAIGGGLVAGRAGREEMLPVEERPDRASPNMGVSGDLEGL